eukprot:TRINITY_DN1788_c0_g1_i1.p1 TRINITY_DN1788_c0_g1~~TRINITY_DN1788_c0_g1_i1.p1  ORF type:complete len:164 (-),score=51.20 TRINITY_DN1788_c0_g1_i1:21-512(-)
MIQSRSEGWNDWEDNEETIPATCLFCPETSGASKIIDHMLHSHGFDFRTTFAKRDIYDRIKMINYLRTLVKQRFGTQHSFASSEALLTHLKESGIDSLAEEWKQEQFLTPVLEGDVLLMEDEDEDDDEDEPKKQTRPDETEVAKILEMLSMRDQEDSESDDDE